MFEDIFFRYSSFYVRKFIPDLFEILWKIPLPSLDGFRERQSDFSISFKIRLIFKTLSVFS